jgi:ribose transport system substrate-binding protein
MKKILFVFCLITVMGGSILGQKKIVIGIIGKSGSNPVFKAAYAGARIAAKELGPNFNAEIQIECQSPVNEDAQEQAEILNKLSRSGVSGIAVSCNDVSILTRAINNAVNMGTEIVCFDSDAPKSRRFAYYGADNILFGRMLVRELAREMNEAGVVAILAGNKNSFNHQQRVQAISEELKKFPSMKLLSNGIFYTEETPEKTAELINRTQKSNPEIGGWIFIGGWPLFLKNAIKWDPGQVKIVSCDALPEELDYLKSGHVQVLLGQNCFLWGYRSVEFLLNKILQNKKPDSEIMPDMTTRVTKKNIDDWSLNWKKWMLKEALNK